MEKINELKISDGVVNKNHFELSEDKMIMYKFINDLQYSDQDAGFFTVGWTCANEYLRKTLDKTILNEVFSLFKKHSIVAEDFSNEEFNNMIDTLLDEYRHDHRDGDCEIIEEQ